MSNSFRTFATFIEQNVDMKTLMPILIVSALVICGACGQQPPAEYTPSDKDSAVAAVVPMPGTMLDAENNEYQTVVIGGQEWMAENLRCKKFSDGKPIPVAQGQDSTKLMALRYSPDTNALRPFGYLYTWSAVERGICPEGWRVPTAADWQTLMDTLAGSDFGSQLAAQADLWEAGTLVTSSEFGKMGFGALPAGAANCYGNFSYRSAACFWTATESDEREAVSYTIESTSPRLNWDANVGKKQGRSVRCVR